MDRDTLKRKLQIIIFELTTPLVSLTGFCDLAKAQTKSRVTLEQLRVISEATEQIRSRKDFLSEKLLSEDDPDFISEIQSANYLQNFALEVKIYENKISTSINELLKQNFETDDLSLKEWVKQFSANAANDLRSKLDALGMIQPDLELVIVSNSGDNF
jgi:hypothetical protein